MKSPNNTNSPTWIYHKETYGEEFVYDDFIPRMALFDAGSTTNRSTVSLGPKRDFIHEIITSATNNHPDLVTGTYFSLPEWFNPAYAPYGFSEWPGGLPHNAYNWSQLEPYTGYIEVKDFIQDIQKPQMEILVGEKYDTNIMWCDIGGPTNITEVVPGWYNRKYQEGKNVVMDDRCNTWAYDFSTPEYSTYGVVTQDKWESNSGLDPFSYATHNFAGYNAQTPAANYMNTTTAVHTLADIVSKNGNWLLDIGPTGNGSVVEPETKTLQGIGAWLKKAGKSIYATDYWFITPQESSNIRFTTTPLAFYITTFDNPSPSFKIASPVPILMQDKITLLGGSGEPLQFSIDKTGNLTISVSTSEASRVSDAWVFEIVYS
ncbi:glycoside hydrolase family 29 protein [Sphaerobolus stellatus SS14]|uniref:alpha-L-fucosidase n=1 Tax=Sphaerobolus stellatus (strain SS14) TaxID=990650 RepID=A0A0C9UBD0_SPHS4|nr:glycoside hydrolase family 29 protein [Sphaerobolus stellatus SS14]